MKRIICIVLCLSLVFCLAACGKKDSGIVSSTGSGEIDRYAKKGEIPELDVKLGKSVDEFKAEYPLDSEDADEGKVLLFEDEGELSVCLATLDAYYYYEKAKKDSGISVIAVTTGEVFGLKLGDTATKSDVTALLAAEYTESSATAEQQFFIYEPHADCKMLSAEFGSVRIDFFFTNDFLFAVTLTDTENWTL